MYTHIHVVCIHRKNGGRGIRISKRKLPDVLGKVKKIVFRRGAILQRSVVLEKGHLTLFKQDIINFTLGCTH